MTTGILAIDQGTTSTRAIIFDQAMKVVATSQCELRQIYPHHRIETAVLWTHHGTLMTVPDALTDAAVARYLSDPSAKEPAAD